MSAGGLVNDWARELLLADDGNTLLPAVRSLTEAGAGVDLDGTETNGALLYIGAANGTAPTLDVRLEEADRLAGPYTPIRRPDPAGTIIAFPTLVDGPHSLLLNFRRTKRYARAVATIGGGSPSFACAVVLFGQRRSF